MRRYHVTDKQLLFENCKYQPVGIDGEKLLDRRWD